MKFRILIVTFFVLCFGTINSYGQYYRSAVAGSWSVSSNWQSSTDNLTWVTSATVPDNNATAITIRNLFNITSSGSVVVDDITIDSGATLTVSGGTFTLNNGTAIIDMQVNGTFTYSGGTFTQNASTVMAFGSNATYNHSIASTTLTLPIATWNPTSNCNVTGMTNATSIVGVNMGQAFGNFTWNNPGQLSATAYVNIQNSGFSVAGTMTVGPSINNVLSFGDSGTYTNTVNRLVVSGGYLSVSGNANVSLNVINDVVVTGTDASNYGSFVISGGTGTAILNIGADLTISVSGRMQVLSASNSRSQTVSVGRDLLISGAFGSQLNLEAVSASGVATVNINRDFICTSSSASIPAVDFGDGLVSNNIINIGRNFDKSGNGFFTTLSNTNFATGFSFNGIGIQTFSYTGANSSYTSYVVQSSSTLIMNSNLTLGVNRNPASRFTIAGGTVNFGTNSIIAGNTTDPRFSANIGSTLITANTNGIGGTTNTGSIQGFGTVGLASVPGRAVFAAQCNYTFNGDTITPFPNFGIGSPININILNVNANVTSNIVIANLQITGIVDGLGALNINNGGTFTLNASNNDVRLNNSSSLNIASGGTFDNNGSNTVYDAGGTPSINISGRFITRDAQGFVGAGSSIPTITPVLNLGSTVEYGLNGNQEVQGATAPTYHNVTFSGSGIKTLASDNAVAGTITVSGSAIFNASNYIFGGVGTNITMTGTSIYRLSGSGLKPEASGIYSLAPGTTFEFYGTFGTTIRTGVSSPVIAYYNVIVSGTNVSNPNTIDGIQFQTGGTFTVKNGAVFKLFNSSGFNGNSSAAVSSNNNPSIILETGSLIEYAGASQMITLFNSPYYTNVTISGTGIKSLQNATQTFINEDLNINGSILLVNTNEVLTVRRALKIATVVTTDIPDFQINNNGQLIQIEETDTNSGTRFQFTRNYTATNVDYIYWGSPTKLYAVSNLPGGFRYEWNPIFSNSNLTQGNWIAPSTNNMTPGKGYIARTFNGSATDITLPFTFRGQPNNGTFTIPISRGSYFGNGTTTGLDYTIPSNPNPITVTRWDDNWNLVSNPYPSAINALTFLSSNSNIEGFVYLWTHQQGLVSTVDPYYYDFGLNYSATANYVLYNSLGVSSGPVSFNGKIASGQGFFVLMRDGPATTNNLSFTNSMRYIASTFEPYDNSQFYRTTPSNETTIGEEEKHRIWLDIVSLKGDSNRTLIGYVDNATNDKDRMYDAITRIDVNSLKIVSYINEDDPQEYSIQGRSLPFNLEDKVRLGVAIPSSGTYKIGIGSLDGMFYGNQNIYIEDKLLNIIQSIKTEPYTFTSNTGIFENRFLLRYTDSTLDNADFETLNNIVIVATNQGELTIKSYIENIQVVTVYDILGRQLFEGKGINNLSFTASNISCVQQALIVKIKLENGIVLSKKVLL
jgi:hypothetical protein